MTTVDERAERRQAALTRETIAAVVRAAIDEGIAAERRRYTVAGLDLEAWLTDITTRTTGALDALLTRALEARGKHAAWASMVAVVEATHRPSSYVKDVYYHDREALEQRQPRVFAWATRATGTWLFLPGTGRDSCLAFLDAAVTSGDDHDWYWWNGRALTRVTPHEARTRVARAERALGEREVHETTHATGGEMCVSGWAAGWPPTRVQSTRGGLNDDHEAGRPVHPGRRRR